MSLRDDLEQLFTCTGRDTRYTEEWQEPYLRLRAALTPAAEKWLEALPGILELIEQGAKKPEFSVDRRLGAKRLDDAVWEAVNRAALRHAQDNKEQK